MSSKMSLNTWTGGPPFPDAKSGGRAYMFFLWSTSPCKGQDQLADCEKLLWVFVVCLRTFFCLRGPGKGAGSRREKWVKRKDFFIPVGQVLSCKVFTLLLHLNSPNTWALICHKVTSDLSLSHFQRLGSMQTNWAKIVSGDLRHFLTTVASPSQVSAYFSAS